MRRLIARYGSSIDADSNKLDRERLLGAIAMVESAGGRNWQPNFEPAFYIGGAYWNDHLAELVNKWQLQADQVLKEACGRLVAASFGPWQVLYVTAEELGYSGPPWGLGHPSVCLTYAIKLINKRILPKCTAEDEKGLVAQIADGYNSGHPTKGVPPADYITKVWRFYQDAQLMTVHLDVLPGYLGS